MSALQRRNMHLKQLKKVKERANKGIHTHEDYRTIVNTLIMLVDRSFEDEIREEKSEELHKEIMDTMDWFDLND